MSEPDSPNLIKRITTLTISRIYETKYTKAFTVLVILTVLICTILEGIIVSSHINVYNELRDDNIIVGEPVTSVNPGQGVLAEDEVALGLRRLKNENVFFILLSLFQLVLGIDALVRQSVMQLICHTFIQILAVVFAAIQVGGTITKNNDVKALSDPEDPRVVWNFGLALRNEIGLVSIMAIFSFLFMYLCWKLYKQFGWSIYKRIGADINQQKRFRLAQLFLLNLKVDAFFQLILCVFYAVVMSQEKYYTYSFSNRKFIGYIIHIILTVLLIPGLLFARHGVITENKKVMITFLVTQVIMCIDFILVLVDSAGSWVFWNLAVCLAIALCISTIVLSILVPRNFGKGLKPFMQRLFESDERKKENQNDASLLKPGNEWLIDDEEDYPMSYTKSNAT